MSANRVTLRGDHTKIANIGTNTHAQIDTHISNVYDSTYTPTSTNLTNVDSSTPAVAGYFRIGNTVHVYGAVTIDPTATGAISISLTIPIARNFTAVSQLSGIGVSSTPDLARIYADTANDYAVLTGSMSVTAARVWSYSFDYFI